MFDSSEWTKERKRNMQELPQLTHIHKHTHNFFNLNGLHTIITLVCKCLMYWVKLFLFETCTQLYIHSSRNAFQHHKLSECSCLFSVVSWRWAWVLLALWLLTVLTCAKLWEPICSWVSRIYSLLGMNADAPQVL